MKGKFRIKIYEWMTKPLTKRDKPEETNFSMDYIFIVLSGLEKSFINFDSKKIWVNKKQIETYNVSAQESRSLNKKKPGIQT